MRKKIFLTAAAFFLAIVVAGCASTGKAKLTTQEVAEVKDWSYSARSLYNFGDYNLSKYYCEKIIDKYPDTTYARKADSLIKKIEWHVKYR